MGPSDLQLLERYHRHQAEDAFAEIVRRHLALVYSAALRQVRSPELAEEVAQSVFVDLARQAHRLAPQTVLAAWLYQVTRRSAIDVVRREARRQLREQVAQELTTMNAATTDWTPIEPLLDEAMEALDQADRTAILLRYFENQPLREVGRTLGTNEDAARKRVNRAVERLRDFLARRGLSVGASGLAVLLSAHAVRAVPVGLGASVCTAAGLGAASFGTTATVLTKAIAMTTLQKVLVAASLTALAGTGLYQARQAAGLRQQVQALQAHQVPLAEQLQELERAQTNAARQLVALREENERLNRSTPELLRLRAAVGRLQREAATARHLQEDPGVQKALAGRTKELKLRELLEQMPGQKIPELNFLDAGTYHEVAQEAELDTDNGVRAALSRLRFIAENQFAIQLQSALANYARVNPGQAPLDLAALAGYADPPLDGAALGRYQLVNTGTNIAGGWDGGWVITQKAAVDPEHDHRWLISPVGFGPSEFKNAPAPP